MQGSPSAFQKYIVNAMAINNAYLKTIYKIDTNLNEYLRWKKKQNEEQEVYVP